MTLSNACNAGGSGIIGAGGTITGIVGAGTIMGGVGAGGGVGLNVPPHDTTGW